MEKEEVVIKAWQDRSWQEIAEAPVDALKGVSTGDADKLDAAFSVETVRELAELKFVRWAQEIVHLADQIDPDDEEVSSEMARAVLEAHYFNHWMARYEAYKHHKEPNYEFLPDHRQTRDSVGSAPSAVQVAHQYYLTSVEQADWGSVRYFLVPVDEKDPAFHLIRVTTDGDDGWVELYDLEGAELGVGRTYIELISWGDRDEIRKQVDTGEFPDELVNRQEDTLWGK